MTTLWWYPRGPVPSDGDERAEPHLVEHLGDAFGIKPRADRCADFSRDRVAGIERAENRHAESQDPGDFPRRQHFGAVEFEQAVEAVFDADGFDSTVAG